MKSGCSVFSANFLWSAVLQHLKRWRRSMNHLLQGTCDGNWTGSDQVTWPKLMTLKKKRSGNIWRPLPAVAVTHLLCIRTTYIHLPTITCWFERSCGFPLQPSADSSSWLLTFTSSKSVHVGPKLTFPPLSICRSALSFGRHWILPCRVLQLHDSWCIQCNHVPEQGTSWPSMKKPLLSCPHK